jgi:hypothetical protein
MKRVIRRAIKKLTRTKFSARGDALRAESRAEIAKMCADGRGWEGLRANVALLGIKTGAGATRPKMVFGAKR